MSQLVPSPQHSPTSGDQRPRWTYTPPPRRGGDDEGTPLDLSSFWRSLRRRWWLLVLTTGLAGGGAWAWARSQPQPFRAVATVRVADDRALTSGLVESRGGNSGARVTSLLSEIEVLRSRRVAARVIELDPIGTRVLLQGIPREAIASLTLADSTTSTALGIVLRPDGMFVAGDSSAVVPYDTPIERNGVRFVVRQPERPEGDALITVLSLDQTVDWLLRSLSVSIREGTDLIDIAFAAGDPHVAVQLVNGFALTYQTEDARNAQEQSRRRRAFIEGQLSRNDSLLREAEAALSAFRSRQQSYSTQQKFEVEQKGLTELRMRLRETESELRYAQTLLRGLESRDDAERRRAQRMLAASSGIGDLPIVQRLTTQLDGYLARRLELTSGPAGKLPTHPQVETVDSLIADVDAALLLAVRAHSSVLQSRVQSIGELAAASERALRGVPTTEVEEARLTQTAEVFREQGGLLRTEFQRARIAEAGAVGHVEVVDLATRAFTLPKPVTRVVVFALFLGLITGGGLAVAGDSIDRTVRNRDDIEHRLHLPVLATIPQIRSDEPKRKRLKGRIGAARPGRAELTARRSAAGESFRQLTATLFLGRNGDAPQRLMVTSAVKGEGKTSVAANLAIALANQRLRVILVDCDPHHPKVHEAFSVSLSPGLGEVILEGRAPTDVINATPFSGLFLMTAGHGGFHPGEIANSPRFRAMIEDLRHDFQVIILDAPPVLAVADPTVITLSADAVLMVVRAGLVTPDETLEALRTLASVNAPVIGAVLNDPDGKAQQYGGYSYLSQYQYTSA